MNEPIVLLILLYQILLIEIMIQMLDTLERMTRYSIPHVNVITLTQFQL